MRVVKHEYRSVLEAKGIVVVDPKLTCSPKYIVEIFLSRAAPQLENLKRVTYSGPTVHLNCPRTVFQKHVVKFYHTIIKYLKIQVLMVWQAKGCILNSFTMHAFLQADRCYSTVCVLSAARIKINIYTSPKMVNLPNDFQQRHQMFGRGLISVVVPDHDSTLSLQLHTLTPDCCVSVFRTSRSNRDGLALLSPSYGIRLYVTNPRSSCCIGLKIRCRESGKCTRQPLTPPGNGKHGQPSDMPISQLS